MATFFRRRLTWRALSLIALETGLVISAVTFAVYVRLGEPPLQAIEEWPKWLLIVAVTQCSLYFADLYDVRVIADRRQLFVRAMYALGATSFALALIYFWFPEAIVGRGVFMIAALCLVTTVLGWRIVFEWMNRHVGPRERLLLVGTSPGAIALARELFERSDLGVEIVGFVDPDPARVGMPVLNPGVIGTIEDIPTHASRALASIAWWSASSDARGRLPMDKLLEMRLDGVAFDHLASVYEEYTGKIAIENLRPSWLIFSSGFRKARLLQATKRASMSLPRRWDSCSRCRCSPSLRSRCGSRPPVLRSTTRSAWGSTAGCSRVHKFRSMRSDAEAVTGAVWAVERRPAGDADRAVPPPVAARRTAAAVERPDRRA